jgi:cytosine permease
MHETGWRRRGRNVGRDHPYTRGGRHVSGADIDDYALSRVPASQRHGWWSVGMQRFGQISALSQFLLGATLGFGMSFWSAFWALTFGAVILELVCILIGIVGCREGLQTSMLARWTGFGQGGSAVVGAAIGISLMGWFGIQSAVSAQALAELVGVLPQWGWSLFLGLLVTLIAVSGFQSMKWVAYITVPAFLALVAWSIGIELTNHSFSNLVRSAPVGPRLSLLEATALVAGSFMVSAVIAPDMTRFNRSTADVIKQTLFGITLGEYVTGLAGVLLAHAIGSDSVVTIVTSSVGWIGLLVIVLGTVKINDWNLYSAGLGIVNFAGTVFGRRVHRGAVTMVVGLIASVLAAVGILDRFTDFLILLGVVFPPISGIMVAEYFVVKRWRPDLERSRANGSVPHGAPTWVPATLVIWLIAALVGQFVHWGLPSINSLVVGFTLYVAAGKLGLIRALGTSATVQSAHAQGLELQHARD